jgi:hypothetical protein
MYNICVINTLLDFVSPVSDISDVELFVLAICVFGVSIIELYIFDT